MTTKQKLALILLAIGTLAFIKFAFFPSNQPTTPGETTTPEEVVKKPTQEQDENAPKSYVNVYFIGQNANGDEVYKVVKRKYDAQKNGTKLKYAIKCLLKGPNSSEKTKGIYSEVPAGTKLISVKESPDNVIINLSESFEQGGGTDGLYKRLYQLIKTANKNTTLDVYLYLDGKQIDVVGGEGIMLNQPLNDKSLDE